MKRSFKSCFLAVLVATFMMSACNGGVQPDGSLQITNKDVINLESSFENNFLESWEYFFLEDDNPDAFMGDINGILYDDGIFFLFSGQYMGDSKLKAFDAQGHFLNDIGRVGRARDEYLHVSDWAINTTDNEILALDNFAQEIKRYSYSGEFLGQIPVAPTKPTDGFLEADFVKHLSNGSIIEYGGLAIIPSYDCFMLGKDGKRYSPFEMTDYRQYCEMDPMEYLRMTGDVGGAMFTTAFSNVLSDTTYLVRLLDNHIYRLANDSVECLANMAFLPEMPLKMKRNYDFQEDDVYDGHTIPNFFYDMKDYLYLWYYYDDEYLFEKSTSKMYHMTHDTLNVSIPDIGPITICDNTIIGCVSDYYAGKALKLMDSPDYDHRYTPELEALYRKVATHENAAIVIAHFK